VGRVACVLVVAALAAVPASAAGSIHVVRLTAHYQLTLGVGPKETMYTADEAKTKHPASGEVMLDSGMDMGGMSMGPGNRHLEVKIVSRATKKLVSTRPTVVLTDTTAMGMDDRLHVMAMYGIEEGRSDLHYGNNVTLTAGHAYTAVVTVKGEKATFSFKA